MFQGGEYGCSPETSYMPCILNNNIYMGLSSTELSEEMVCHDMIKLQSVVTVYESKRVYQKIISVLNALFILFIWAAYNSCETHEVSI